MKKIVKTFLLPFTVALALQMQPLAASCCPTFNPCPTPKNCWGKITVEGSYLWWKPCVGGLCVADRTETILELDIESIVSLVGVTTLSIPSLIDLSLGLDASILNSKPKNIAFDEESGYRVEVGYQLPCSCWDITARWTRFHPDDRSTFVNNDLSGSVFENLLDINLLTPCTGLSLLNNVSLNVAVELLDLLSLRLLNSEEVKGKWEMELDVIDLEFGRQFCFGNGRFKPQIGLRYARIDNKLDIFSKGRIFQLDVDLTNLTNFLNNPVLGGLFGALDLPLEGIEADVSFVSDEKVHQKFNGIGPRFAIDAQWELFCNFGVYGNFGVSALYGEIEKTNSGVAARLDAEADLELITAVVEVDFEESHNSCHYCVIPVTDVAVGFYYAVDFCDGAFGFDVKVGWEHNYYWNQGFDALTASNGLLGIVGLDVQRSASGDNDLSMQGLVASIGLSF